ncbi:MAG: class I SAM-dependent methyltransferase, partial [Verrucomicrobiota bacterium]
WQLPIMKLMARQLNSGDVLEIGFGRGIASDFLQEQSIRSHTIIEVNESVIARCNDWKKNYPGRDIRVISGRWQGVLNQLETYDGIFFHTYPLNQEEFVEQIARSVTFGEHFFPTAQALLRPGGTFTYLSNEIDSLSRDHQRLLLQYFSSFSVSRVEGLKLPKDVRDAWWADSMILIKAIR